MSILIDRNTRVMTRGVMAEAARKIVAAVAMAAQKVVAGVAGR
jgi:hypothetical protein